MTRGSILTRIARDQERVSLAWLILYVLVLIFTVTFAVIAANKDNVLEAAAWSALSGLYVGTTPYRFAEWRRDRSHWLLVKSREVIKDADDAEGRPER